MPRLRADTLDVAAAQRVRALHHTFGWSYPRMAEVIGISHRTLLSALATPTRATATTAYRIRRWLYNVDPHHEPRREHA